MSIFIKDEKEDFKAFSAEAWLKRFPQADRVSYETFTQNPDLRRAIERQTKKNDKIVLLNTPGRVIGAVMPLPMFLDQQRLANESGWLSLEYPVQIVTDANLKSAGPLVSKFLTRNYEALPGGCTRPYNMLLMGPDGNPQMPIVNVKYINRYLAAGPNSECRFRKSTKAAFERGYYHTPEEVENVMDVFGQAAFSQGQSMAKGFRTFYAMLDWPPEMRCSFLSILDHAKNGYRQRNRSQWFIDENETPEPPGNG